jgi:hypothetical protein
MDRDPGTPGQRIPSELHEERAGQTVNLGFRPPDGNDRLVRVKEQRHRPQPRGFEARLFRLETYVGRLVGQAKAEPDAGHTYWLFREH